MSDVLSCTGCLESSLHKSFDELRLDFVAAKLRQFEFVKYGISVVVLKSAPKLGPNDLWHHLFAVSDSVTPGSPIQGATSVLSPLVRSQVEQIIDDISVKLRERLSMFEAYREDVEPVSTTTKVAVNNLVTWLCSESDTVSATLSNDGTLSIASGFQNDVRLYIEIERNGSTEAAVTRERRIASDIYGNTVADLTPEVLLDAIGSI